MKNFNTLVTLMLTEHYAHARSPATARSILGQAKAILGPETPLSSITRDTLRGYVTKLRNNGDAPASIVRKLSVVMRSLREARDEGWITEVPRAPSISKPQRRRLRTLTEQELESMAARMQPRCGDLVYFLADTGLRLGEALRLEWRDTVDGVVSVWQSKNGKPRQVPLIQRAQAVLATGSATGAEKPWPFNVSIFRRAWDKAKSGMGLQGDKDFVPHALRHTFASRLVQAGASLQHVKELLGHSRLENTLIYAHLAPRNLRESVSLLETYQ